MYQHRHRVLVISSDERLRPELVTLLSGYGYFVEETSNRLAGIRRFKEHKQSIIIIDMAALRRFPKRIFGLIKLIQRHAVILVAARKEETDQALEHLHWGAYDILQLPLKTEFLIHTLARAQLHHQQVIVNMFLKNVLFFGLLMAPLWLVSLYLLLR